MIRIYDWQPASFGRWRKVSPLEARRWAQHPLLGTRRAPHTPDWRSFAPKLAEMDAAGLSTAEQAEVLGLKRTTVTGIRARLIKDLLLTPRQRGRGRSWSKEQEQKLADLVEQGYGYDELATKLKRTRTAVILKCRRLRVRVTTTQAMLAARDVAALLGKRCSKSVTRWIQQGWLRARNAGGAGHTALWRVQWDDLTTFLEQRAYWSTWEPARITDACLREWAQELRANEPRYLTQGQVAARFHVTTEAVGQWIDKGWLPAVRAGKQNRLVAESDLVGWVPPCQRSKAGIPKAMGRRIVGKDQLVASEPRRRAARPEVRHAA